MKTMVRSSAVALLATLAACGPSREVQERLAQLEAVAVEKDSLLQIVVDNARLMSDINTEIARVTAAENAVSRPGESPMQVSRDSILGRVQLLTQRLVDSEERLARSERRVRSLTGVSDSLRNSITNYETLVTDFRHTIDDQRNMIASLNDRVVNLETENARLTLANLTLTDSVGMIGQSMAQLTADTRRAWYIIGTKDELKAAGIIREEGGSRFPLIFSRTGTTLVPANDLDESLFTEIDLTATTTIPLPENDRDYRIVSTQDLAGLEGESDEGKVRGELRITDPAEFWTPSRFLIVVRS